MTVRHWTALEYEFVKANYSTKTDDWLGSALKRSRDQIMHFRHRHGFAHPPKHNFSHVRKITLSETDRLWLGCATDCEGSIGIQQISPNTRNHNRAYVPYLLFTNTDRLLAEKYASILQMSINHRELPNPNWKPAYRIVLQQREAVRNVLCQIHPYLIAKRKHAELVIEFIDSRISHETDFKWQQRIPYTERELEIFNEVRTLNAGKGANSAGRTHRVTVGLKRDPWRTTHGHTESESALPSQ